MRSCRKKHITAPVSYTHLERIAGSRLYQILNRTLVDKLLLAGSLDKIRECAVSATTFSLLDYLVYDRRCV